MSVSILWFRQDLRISDNPALVAACHGHQSVIPVYIYDEKTLPMGAAQKWWLHHSLLKLQASLEAKGLQLLLLHGDPLQQLSKLIKHHNVSAVYWNRCYEPQIIERDQKIKSALLNKGIAVETSNGSLLNEPWTIKNKSGEYFKVFTPYWRYCLTQMNVPAFLNFKTTIACPDIAGDRLESWGLLPNRPNWAAAFANYWAPGELGAKKKLDAFIKSNLNGYKKQRDVPAKDATSKLSPHLHFGEISPWQIWRAIEHAKADKNVDMASADHFLSEVGWREFSYYLLYHYPGLPDTNFRREFDGFLWKKNAKALKQWQQGMTGYPIVDAGMRELWKTGYMHNRVRMIVASFLIKDLFIDWREGAKWFWDTLLDADLANNSASWQWVAGSGADAAPYFRIFNPVLQGEKFDPEGTYVRQWVPELAKVGNQWLHQPWTCPSSSQLGIVLGKDYPMPIVDHKEARDIALASYKNLKS